MHDIINKIADYIAFEYQDCGMCRYETNHDGGCDYNRETRDCKGKRDIAKGISKFFPTESPQPQTPNVVIKEYCGKTVDKNIWACGFYWTNRMGNHFIRVIEQDGYFINPIDFEVKEESICEYSPKK